MFLSTLTVRNISYDNGLFVGVSMPGLVVLLEIRVEELVLFPSDDFFSIRLDARGRRRHWYNLVQAIRRQDAWPCAPGYDTFRRSSGRR